jgi:hypothetical protein
MSFLSAIDVAALAGAADPICIARRKSRVLAGTEVWCREFPAVEAVIRDLWARHQLLTRRMIATRIADMFSAERCECRLSWLSAHRWKMGMDSGTWAMPRGNRMTVQSGNSVTGNTDVDKIGVWGVRAGRGQFGGPRRYPRRTGYPHGGAAPHFGGATSLGCHGPGGVSAEYRQGLAVRLAIICAVLLSEKRKPTTRIDSDSARVRTALYGGA